MSQQKTAHDHLAVLRDSLRKSTPWTSGVLDVRPDDLVLFYRQGQGARDARSLTFGATTEEQLEELAKACTPATFGLGTEDVLDESYRKAGKLDIADFASSLDLGTLRLVEAISPDLLDGRDDVGEKGIRAELYKLNVYGPGSFFKAHKDTPRAADMIGSLVIVFPSAHAGGQLSLSHGESNTFSFDSAALLANKPGSIAFVAFFSDVTHAVEQVVSGYRVTLTYNLFLVDTPMATRQLSVPESASEAALRALLANPKFLPAGGLLGFGLEHQYPVPKTASDPATLAAVLTVLKGADARLQSAAARVGLENFVKLVYKTPRGWDRKGGENVVLEKVMNFGSVWDEDGEVAQMLERQGEVLRPATEADIGKAAEGARPEEAMEEADDEDDDYEETDSEDYEDADSDTDGGRNDKRTAVFWVTRPKAKLNRADSPFIAMGNQAEMGHSYGDAALFVRFPPMDQRV
ncbi:Fe2OG dioxygenase domain-containing protein [Mycena indigotica]|uniref:Fe2OG dioxygenase domain-containing protein n=1 Tax=Mycena indigotica TaxID=2126181 RepID=A0A8H6VT07_9AGAR|nr:Fe2OG dioxygenase domain-containing protein [Mycena indigotica]KAF7288963.1 Fe2OG dioxygenase domain-containing protein [Mycena indigotica]